MKLTQETKQKIIDEYNEWFEDQYGDKSLEERKELGAFFTPPDLTIQMIEKFDCDSLENKTILDPTLGAGGLIAGCIIAGADPKKCYGNEIDADILDIARRRLKKFNVPVNNLHQGDATETRCIEKSSFTSNYIWERYEVEDLW